MTPDLTLYDLAGADPTLRFSPHCWKTHMALAHKGLTANTVPWRFTDKEAIEFSGQKLVPVLVHGDHVISDSWQIACYLEDTFPERPSLFGGDTGRALSLFANSWADTTLVPTLARLLLPEIHALIDAKDKDYFRHTREKRFGRLEDLPALREEQLAALRASLLPLRQMLARQPYLAGQQPAYGDYAVFGFFMWARCTSALELLAADDPVAAWRERLLDAHGGLARQAPVAAA
ncbi:glutathione S-transferase family protein [Achromobacter ruhlandii]|uniref:Beta-etherase n=1 Tax=Achromobacter ruhlandii TaxID=72557 RepID=A0ABM8LXI6_9BURK|nr:glutathione S-transferase family protein [Achromobacter ruhlandii]AOU92694.1 glutathione S-transferase [Achromobacter ruhlandii]MCZ8430797.1 glutathione S-transferase family protein [Achromobacter ruhlandii]MDC6087852.1 glutathione S-transferase family protein [Achromobacter ruhlandii]MDC6150267.1 glutathione S-transferase family protein [Achromobacter ruhlandii]MDD7978562.1 glutathione S-transferase family protein [Achromobacter ruhlandii]